MVLLNLINYSIKPVKFMTSLKFYLILRIRRWRTGFLLRRRALFSWRLCSLVYPLFSPLLTNFSLKHEKCR